MNQKTKETREKIISLLQKEIENKNIIKHMLATEACMKALAEKLGGDPQEWGLAGLVHDLDYQPTIPPEKHGLLTKEILAKAGISLPETILQAVAAHNWHMNKVKPKSLMDWTLFIIDSLTGLIVATTLVMPSKKLADVQVKNVLNRFKEKSFARGTRREDILLCQEKLGLSLEELVEICLEAMKGISEELGL